VGRSASTVISTVIGTDPVNMYAPCPLLTDALTPDYWKLVEAVTISSWRMADLTRESSYKYKRSYFIAKSGRDYTAHSWIQMLDPNISGLSAKLSSGLHIRNQRMGAMGRAYFSHGGLAVL
jgi:hypothetical protein